MADIRATTPGAKGSAFPLQPNATYLGEVKMVYPDNTVGVYVKKLTSTFSRCKVVGSPLLKPIVKGDRVVCGLLDGLKQELVVYGAYDTTGDTQALQVRSDTAANWTSVNPTLAVGEIGFETDTGKFKIGALQTYAIGDTGPGGGKIFITPSTAGNSTGQYFEVAPVAAEVQRSWSTGANQSIAVTGADGTAIGTGAQNTIDIVAQSGNVAATSAAVYCSDLVYGGKSDWFLPSKDELNQMYVNRVALNTSFNTTGNYWSSSEANSTDVWYNEFVLGLAFTFGGYKYSSLYVRPVRAFTVGMEWEHILYATDASDITGATLASNVTGSSLTSVGTLGSLTVTGDVTVDTSTLKVDSTNNRVGIGTATPAEKLDVAGTIRSSGTITATSYVHGTDYLSPYQGFRNYLINGGFNIWQRGTSSASTGVATADRWYNLTSGTTTFSQDASDFPTGVGVRYSNKWTTGAGSSYGQIYQALESSTVIPLRGSTMTLSAWVKRGSTALTGNLAFSVYYSSSSDAYASLQTLVAVTFETIVPNTTWFRWYCTFTVPSDAVGLKVGIAPTNVQASGVVVYFAGMQLERGFLLATPFEQRPIGTELALCQRYYFASGVVWSGFVANNANQFGEGFSFQFPVTMRATPTLTNSFTSNDNAVLQTSSVTDKSVYIRETCSNTGFPYSSFTYSYTVAAEL